MASERIPFLSASHLFRTPPSAGVLALLSCFFLVLGLAGAAATEAACTEAIGSGETATSTQTLANGEICAAQGGDAVIPSPMLAGDVQTITPENQQPHPAMSFYGSTTLNYTDGVSLKSISDSVTQAPKRGDDWYADLRAGATYVHNFGNDRSLLLAYDLGYSAYVTRKNYNQLSNKLTAEVDFAGIVFGHAIGVYADIAHLGTPIKHYSNTFGVNWVAARPISQQTNVSFAFTGWKTNYINTTSIDGIGGKLGASVSYAPQEKAYSINFDADLSKFNAERSTYTYNLLSANLGLNYSISRKDFLNLGLSAQRFDYRGFDTIQTSLRRDDAVYGVSLSYQHRLRVGLSVNAGVSYTKTDSNIQRFEFDNRLISIGIRRNL